jgi:hypothetical protein
MPYPLLRVRACLEYFVRDRPNWGRIPVLGVHCVLSLDILGGLFLCERRSARNTAESQQQKESNGKPYRGRTKAGPLGIKIITHAFQVPGEKNIFVMTQERVQDHSRSEACE